MVYHFNFLEKNAFEMEHVCRVIVYVRFLKKTKLQLSERLHYNYCK